MKIVIMTLLLLAFVGAIQADEYFDAGSLGRELWSPTSNEVEKVLLRVEKYCRYSDAKKASSTVEVEITVNDEVLQEEVFMPSLVSNTPSLKENLLDEVSIAGLSYSEYRQEVKSFIQPYGEKEFKFIAVQYTPEKGKKSEAVSSIRAKPFTVYYNLTNDRVGLTLGFPVILYSPGPPFSFHKKVVEASESGATLNNRHLGACTTNSVLKSSADLETGN